MSLLISFWASAFIVHLIDESVFIRTFKNHFTGEEYKEVVNYCRPQSFVGYLAVMVFKFVLGPLLVLVSILTPYDKRVAVLRDTLLKQLPQYEKELKEWAIEVCKPELKDSSGDA